MNSSDIKSIMRYVGFLLVAEGILMLSCLVPAFYFSDGTATDIIWSGCITLVCGLGLALSFHKYRSIQDRRCSYLLVVILWVILSIFGSLPFVITGVTNSWTDAFFEIMSGLTSTGATIFEDVESLPSSILLWRSMSQWLGGFGIVLIVLALAPKLGINRYTLYTAEASGADNTGKTSSKMSNTMRKTLSAYIFLTLVFIVALLCADMSFFDAVNFTFCNISSGGFSVYNDSVASLTHAQQWILACCMFLSGVNFMMLYMIITFKWSRVRHKLDQFSFYFGVIFLASIFVVAVLSQKSGMPLEDSIRVGVFQTISVASTTGSVIADTTTWWAPVSLIYLTIACIGGMAGSTSGGIKAMRAIILLRNVRAILSNRLHPHRVNPVRLNGHPVSDQLITNVLVVFILFLFSIFVAFLILLVCGVNSIEAIGATVGCITSYGPGLGDSGGFGNYANFPVLAKWTCSALMLLGRLEYLSLFILFLPRFWSRKTPQPKTVLH